MLRNELKIGMKVRMEPLNQWGYAIVGKIKKILISHVVIDDEISNTEKLVYQYWLKKVD